MQQEIKKLKIPRKDGSQFRLDYDGIDEYTGMIRYILTENYERPVSERRKFTIFSDGAGIDFNAIMEDRAYYKVLAEELLSKQRVNQKIVLAQEITGQSDCLFVGHISHNPRTGKYQKYHVENDSTSLAKINQSIRNGLKKKDIETQNIQKRPQNIALCREAVMGGYGFTKVEGDISLGRDMYASSSIGNIRTTQEDAVLLIRHPENSDFKMMVVADGMGGVANGERASADVIIKLKKWFESLDQRLYSNESKLEEKLAEALILINRDMYDKYKTSKAGSTVIASIVGKNTAIIANIGDSRAYTTKDGQMRQITEDDSLVYRLYQHGNILEKDDIRFHERANEITQYMGQEDDVSPYIITIKKKTFDSIILCSDGVTDCLSDEQIITITKNTDKSLLSKKLVEAALRNTSRKRPGLDDEYKDTVAAGKDNTTVAVMDNNECR